MQYKARVLLLRVPFKTYLLFVVFLLTALCSYGCIAMQPADGQFVRAVATLPNTPPNSKNSTDETSTAHIASNNAAQPEQPKAIEPAAAQQCVPGVIPLVEGVDLAGMPNGVSVIERPSQYYAVYGNTITQIKQQLLRCSPDRANGGVAATRTRFAYSYSVTDYHNGTCTISQAKVAAVYAYSLPSWQDDGQTDSRVRATWQRFISAIQTHESQHAALGVQYACSMVTALNALSGQCSTINATAASTIATLQSQHDIANEAYDAATHHGITRGTRL